MYSFNLKRGKGLTGVDLLRHHKDEFNKLSEPQKEELKKWKWSDDGTKATEIYTKTRCAKREGNASFGKSNYKKFKKAIAAVIENQKG